MAKQIKDLTEDEIYGICQKQGECIECPLYLGADIEGNATCLRFDHEKFEKALEIADKEIEVKL